MSGRPKSQVGLQKTVPERSVDSERQKSEISIKTSEHITLNDYSNTGVLKSESGCNAVINQKT